MTTLFINIKELIQVRDTGCRRKLLERDMSILPTIKNAFMMIENDNVIVDFGPMEIR